MQVYIRNAQDNSDEQEIINSSTEAFVEPDEIIGKTISNAEIDDDGYLKLTLSEKQ